MIQSGETILVALGGNALVREGEESSIATQFRNVQKAMRAILPLIRNGNQLVITHGNGFQVGNILIRVEEALGKAYPIPLEVCVAESQGELGYMIEQSLQNVLVEQGIRMPVASVLTQVIVDPDDPAFEHPTKPIGPAYSDAQASELRKQGFELVNDPSRGWRKLVASPRPVEIDDVQILQLLLQNGVVVIAAGGGGIPVVRDAGNTLRGVPAVIDKDLASSTLALAIGAAHLVILTDVQAVYLDYLEPEQRALRTLSVEDAEGYAAAGQFPAGSMGPKIEAAIQFLRGGGKSVIITASEALSDALVGKAGTTITRTIRKVQS
jgi:carbamate kinase